MENEIKLALELSKIVHAYCKDVPHDIGLKLVEAIKNVEKDQFKCDWCGMSGDVVTKHYHQKCNEAILNGEGMI